MVNSAAPAERVLGQFRLRDMGHPPSMPDRESSTIYDAILVVGFGGPEKPDDVIPFLENVTRGRGVPRDRLLAVAEHYHHFGGASPINAQVRDLIAALEPELTRSAISLPIYWGNRNWHPMLADTLAQMTRDGVKRAPGNRSGGLQLVFKLPPVSRKHRERAGRLR